MDDIQTEEEKKELEGKSAVAEKIAAALGDKVKKVIPSMRLGDASASVIMDENDPSLEMQRLMKQMGGPEEDIKPILEINPSSAFVKKIEDADEEKAKILSEVLLGQALLQEGIMPSDPVAFALNLRKAMEA